MGGDDSNWHGASDSRRLIYLAGGFCWDNKGDAALVLSLVEGLRDRIPHLEFVLTSVTPETDSAYFAPFGISVVSHPFGHRWIAGVRRVKRWLDRSVGWRLRRKSAPEAVRCSNGGLGMGLRLLEFGELLTLRADFRVTEGERGSRGGKAGELASRGVLRWADAVVLVPGGYLIGRRPDLTACWESASAALLASRLGKPLLSAPISAGPFKGSLNRRVAQLALRGASPIQLREHHSMQALLDLGVPAEALRTYTDLAFALRDHPERARTEWRERIRATKSLRVGVSVRGFQFPESAHPAKAKAAYVRAMAALVRHIVEAHDGSVWFMPQSNQDRRDIYFAEEIAREAAVFGPVHFVDDDLNPWQLKSLYGSCDLFVGVRMDANIFAITSLVPTLAIAYQHKTSGIMEAMGLGEWVIPIDGITVAGLTRKFDALVACRADISDALPESVERMRTLANASLDELALRISRVPPRSGGR